MTSGSNCRHLNRPQTEDARRSIRPAYHGVTAKLQHFPPSCQVRWVNKQYDKLKSKKGKVLTEAFDEWLVRHSDQIIQTGNLGDLVSAALDEFINRHRDEFVPVEPLRLEQGRTQLSNYLGTKRGGDGEIGGSAPRADRLAGRAGGGCAASWNKRVPFLRLTYMPTRVQIGERVV
jgi:hypothetical protein